MKHLLSSLLVCIFLPLSLSHAMEIEKQPGYLKGEFVFEKTSFPSCHASTIVQANDGTIIAAWFGGTAEKNPDVGVWVSRLEAGKWTSPVEVANGIQSPKLRYPCWNPVFFQPKDNPLMLFYKVGPTPSSWWGVLKRSSDNGKTWGKAELLPKGILGPIKNKAVLLSNGDLLCPTSSEHDGWCVHFERTSDLGKTWTKTKAINDGKAISAIQPSVLFHSKTKLQALGRTRQGKIWESWSDDLGKSWSKMKLINLPNPNAGTDAVTLKDGRHLLVYNHTRRGRSPLNVAISKDGKKWNAALVLEDQHGEYSYPAVIQTDDGLVHITYTYQRKKIKHIVIDPEKLKLTPIIDGAWVKE